MPSETLLRMVDAVKHFPLSRALFGSRPGEAVRAVDGVNLELRRAETLGLIGESGCGKSTLGRLLLGLHSLTSGEIYYRERATSRLGRTDWERLRRSIQIIFQDPYSSLDPRMTVYRSISEPMRVHTRWPRSKRKERVAELLELVGLPADSGPLYPHEFSGGQRQRIGFARALALEPELVVCDEPVSALDVSIQAQVLGVLRRIQAVLGLTYLFISHDMAVVRYMSDRIAVMYLGKIVEMAPRAALFDVPRHPYTIALLSAVPVPNPAHAGQRKKILLRGDVPSPVNVPKGCRFHTRCPVAMEICRRVSPEMREVGPDHLVACHWDGKGALR